MLARPQGINLCFDNILSDPDHAPYINTVMPSSTAVVVAVCRCHSDIVATLALLAGFCTVSVAALLAGAGRPCPSVRCRSALPSLPIHPRSWSARFPQPPCWPARSGAARRHLTYPGSTGRSTGVMRQTARLQGSRPVLSR